MVRLYVALLNSIANVNRDFKSNVYSGHETSTQASPSLPNLAQAPSASLITC